jgi:hypothetical protein
MRIFYLHDWCDDIDEAKYKILTKFGDEIQYQKIDYKNSKCLISHISDLLRKDKNSVVVGYSFGAYLAYYASTYAERPSLLINPSFFFKNGGELYPESCRYSSTDKTFIISMKNETLDIRKTLKFLRDTNVPESNVKLYDDLTHILPIEIFDKEFTEFRNKYSERERLYQIIEQEKQANRSKQEKLCTDDIWIDSLSDIIGKKINTSLNISTKISSKPGKLEKVHTEPKLTKIKIITKGNTAGEGGAEGMREIDDEIGNTPMPNKRNPINNF